jgi:putative membrane protein
MELVRQFIAIDVRRLSLRVSPVAFGLHVSAMVAYALLTVLGLDRHLPEATVLAVVFFFSFSFAHLIAWRGFRLGLLLFGIAFGLTLAFEAFGVATGALFGDYAYSDQLGPKAFGLVPFIIPIAWFMVLYPASATAGFLLAVVLPGLAGWRRALLHSGLAALAMTAWDLSLDPRMVEGGYWAWQGGGAYFGIPLSNYLGWWISSFAIFLAWNAIDSLARRSARRVAPPDANALLPVWAYILTWIGESMATALFWSGPAVAVFVFAGMGAFAGPALFVLLRRAGGQAAPGGLASWSALTGRR